MLALARLKNQSIEGIKNPKYLATQSEFLTLLMNGNDAHWWSGNIDVVRHYGGHHSPELFKPTIAKVKKSVHSAMFFLRMKDDDSVRTTLCKTMIKFAFSLRDLQSQIDYMVEQYTHHKKVIRVYREANIVCTPLLWLLIEVVAVGLDCLISDLKLHLSEMESVLKVLLQFIRVTNHDLIESDPSPVDCTICHISVPSSNVFVHGGCCHPLDLKCFLELINQG